MIIGSEERRGRRREGKRSDIGGERREENVYNGGR